MSLFSCTCVKKSLIDTNKISMNKKPPSIDPKKVIIEGEIIGSFYHEKIKIHLNTIT